MRFHLLQTAKLDPVWLWDWIEGLNAGLVTVRAVLDLVDEIPELTFEQGKLAIYDHITRKDKPSFRQIDRMILRIRVQNLGKKWQLCI